MKGLGIYVFPNFIIIRLARLGCKTGWMNVLCANVCSFEHSNVNRYQLFLYTFQKWKTICLQIITICSKYYYSKFSLIFFFVHGVPICDFFSFEQQFSYVTFNFPHIDKMIFTTCTMWLPHSGCLVECQNGGEYMYRIIDPASSFSHFFVLHREICLYSMKC